jgi:hypothetical protein
MMNKLEKSPAYAPELSLFYSNWKFTVENEAEEGNKF